MIRSSLSGLDLPTFALPDIGRLFRAAGDNPLSHVVPHPIDQRPADLGLLTPEGLITVFSDQIVVMILGCLLLCILFPMLVNRRRGADGVESMVPRPFANFVEMVCEYWRSVAEQHLGEHADKFIKYIWSAFFFVLAMNLLGMIPLAAVTPLFGPHIGGTPTGNIWVTATLAILTMFLMVWNGLRIGGKDYLAHFSPGPIWMAPLMIPVEIMGLFAKIFALAVRLFANMVAGHVLLAVLISMVLQAGQALGLGIGLGVAIPVVIGAVAVTLLEVFVAFLQAFIFTFLTVLFIGMSINVHHDDHAEAAAH
ncbi:MAG: F0F1 ATP synthase subunit A [Acidobacteriota bacterium]